MSNSIDRFLKKKEQLIDLEKQVILLSSGLIGLIITFKNSTSITNQLYFTSGLVSLVITILIGLVIILFLINEETILESLLKIRNINKPNVKILISDIKYISIFIQLLFFISGIYSIGYSVFGTINLFESFSTSLGIVEVLGILFIVIILIIGVLGVIALIIDYFIYIIKDKFRKIY